MPGVSRTVSWSTAELMEALRVRDPEAWDELVHRYGALVTGVARRHRLQECDVADAVQNTWIRALERLDTVRDPGRLGGWLGAVAARESLALIRRAHREPVLGEADDPESPERGPEAEAVLAEARRVVLRCVEGLDERSRALARELFVDPDRGYRQVARTTGMPIGSIGPTRGRLLHRLRILLEEAGYPGDGV